MNSKNNNNNRKSQWDNIKYFIELDQKLNHLKVLKKGGKKNPKNVKKRLKVKPGSDRLVAPKLRFLYHSLPSQNQRNLDCK